MKIVQINSVYEYSSTGRTTKELHLALLKQGFQSEVFYATPNKQSKSKELIGSKIGHKLHAFLSRLFGKQAYYSYFPTRRLIKKLQSILPDVVILRNFHSNYIHMPLLLKYLAKENIATIVVLHDCWFFTGHCCHYTEIGCNRWQTECHHCPLIHMNNKSWFFDNSRSIFRDKKWLFGAIPNLAVIGVSDWITNEGRKAPIFENAKIFQRIYNWIDFKKFHYRENAPAIREKLGLASNDFVALGVSMLWDDRKGLDVICSIARMMTEIKIVLIGKMPENDYPDNIISVAPTNSTDQLAEYYSMADVFLNFSIQETFGKVSAEALACGTPLVVNNATANPEIPGPCGEIIDNRNLNDVVDAIKRIRAKGKNAYFGQCIKRAHDLFDKEKNIQQYVELFDNLQHIVKCTEI